MMNLDIRKWVGYLLTVGLLVGGYIYNFKFIQLGVPDLGHRVLGLDSASMSGLMSLLAILTCVIAIIWGRKVDSIQWTIQKRFDTIVIIGAIQGGLTVWAGYMTAAWQLPIWIIFTSIVLGIGIPVSFPLMFELIPTNARGIIAGLIAGSAYLAGNLSPFPWTVTGLMQESLMMLVPGLFALVLLRVTGLFNKLLPDPYPDVEIRGKFEHYNVLPMLILMFLIFFIDSLGFLRIIGEDSLFNRTWHADLNVRFILGVVHFIAGIVAGVIYSKTNPKVIGIIVLVMFAIADILISFYTPAMAQSLVLTISCIYCATVSVYTVNNFTIWSDISKKTNTGKNAAWGIAIGGWLSSFLSTSLVYQLEHLLSFQVHLILPGILAIISLIGLILVQKRKPEIFGKKLD